MWGRTMGSVRARGVAGGSGGGLPSSAPPRGGARIEGDRGDSRRGIARLREVCGAILPRIAPRMLDRRARSRGALGWRRGEAPRST